MSAKYGNKKVQRVYRSRIVDKNVRAFAHVSRIQSEQEMYDMAVTRDVALKQTRDELSTVLQERDDARREIESLRKQQENLRCQQCDTLRLEIGALRVDAERYRHIREHAASVSMGGKQWVYGRLGSLEALDAFIDAERSKR